VAKNPIFGQKWVNTHIFPKNPIFGVF